MSINGCTINAFSINGSCVIRHILPPNLQRGGVGSAFWRNGEDAPNTYPSIESDFAEVTATLFDQCGQTIVIGKDVVDMSDRTMPMIYAFDINISEVKISVTVENIEITNLTTTKKTGKQE